MAIIVFLFCLIITIIFPVLAIPLNIFGMVISRGALKKHYGFLLAFSLAVVAYLWVPNSKMDLYRFHHQMSALVGFDFEQLGVFLKTNLEPAHYLIEFAVAQTGNFSLLQFIVVLCGYFELFWIISDYSETKKVRRSIFVLLFLYTVFSLRFIDFASGLWFNLAIINIAMGVYISYFGRKKHLQYLFYIIAICLHIGVFYMLVVMLLINKLRLFKRVGFLPILLTFLVAILFGVAVSATNIFLGPDSAFMEIVNKMYNEYFVNQITYSSLEYYLRIFTVVLGLIMAIWYSKYGHLKEYGSLLAYFSVYILSTILNAGIFSRYSFLIAILSMPFVEFYFRNVKNKHMRLALLIIILSLSACRIMSACEQFESSGITRQVEDNITNSFLNIINNEEAKL